MPWLRNTKRSWFGATPAKKWSICLPLFFAAGCSLFDTPPGSVLLDQSGTAKPAGSPEVSAFSLKNQPPLVQTSAEESSLTSSEPESLFQEPDSVPPQPLETPPEAPIEQVATSAPPLVTSSAVERYTPPPLSLRNNEDHEHWDLSLDAAIQLGLAESTVLRDLGGAILQAPALVDTIHAPAIRYTDPRFGVEAALSRFDAQFSTQAFFEKNDRALNNIFVGGGTRLFQQDLHNYEAELLKRSATGGTYALRGITEYDANNSPGNLFGSAHSTLVEGEVRQPLMQGAGLEFNRIAGFDPVPFVFNGVKIAQVDADIEVADFEAAIRDYVSNVENAYWDLYFAYRNLDTKRAARDRSLQTWQKVKALLATNARGGDPATEARAREQYFRYEEEVRDALAGRPIDGTRTNNGSGGGTFRGGGVFVAERRLRLLIGLPLTDGRLIRPSSEPSLAEVTFDWDTILTEALSNRPELQQQRLRIQRREMELTASRNFLKPRLDAVTRYRVRGFGKNFIDPSGDDMRFGNAVETLADGSFQEWQVGLELDVPIGFRRAHSAVRNAELLIARERAIMHEQERQVVFELSNALAETQRAYDVLGISMNRYQAAKVQLQTTEQDYERNRATAEQLLDAQRRVADAQSQYFASLVEYGLSIRNVHYEKGSLMAYNQISLTTQN